MSHSRLARLTLAYGAALATFGEALSDLAVGAKARSEISGNIDHARDTVAQANADISAYADHLDTPDTGTPADSPPSRELTSDTIRPTGGDAASTPLNVAGEKAKPSELTTTGTTVRPDVVNPQAGGSDTTVIPSTPDNNPAPTNKADVDQPTGGGVTSGADDHPDPAKTGSTSAPKAK